MNRRAMTLPELMVTMSLFLLLSITGWAMLQLAQQSYLRISGHGDVGVLLKKAAFRVQKDLQPGNYNETVLDDCPVSLPGGAKDGMALCVLSSAANGTGLMATKPGGQPFYQRNILYYLIVPQGDSCQGGADAQGYDDRCPHKMLLRKTIDSGAATTPTSPDSDEEQLLGALGPYLTRPVGRSVSAMSGEAGLVGVEIVVSGLLSMRVERTPDANFPGEVRVTFKAFNQVASRNVAIGTAALADHEHTLVHPLAVFPRNNQ